MTLKTFLALLLVIPVFAFSQTQKGIPGKNPNVDYDTLIWRLFYWTIWKNE